MAIPINKYIDIVSGVAGRDLANRRDFMGLVLTSSEAARNYFVEMAETGEDGIPWIAEFANDDEVREAFGASSEEYHFAIKYFSFVSKSITRPKLLKFAYWEKDFPANNSYNYTSYAQRATNYSFSMKNFEEMSTYLPFKLSLEGIDYSFTVNLADETIDRSSTTAFYNSLVAAVNKRIAFLHVDDYQINSVESLEATTEEAQSTFTGRDYYHFKLQIAKDEAGNDLIVEGRPLYELVSRIYTPGRIQATPSSTKTVKVGTYSGGKINYANTTLSTTTYYPHYNTETTECVSWATLNAHPLLCGDPCGGEDVVFKEGFEVFGIGSFSTPEVFKNESPVDAISRISSKDDNFGTFMFLEELANEDVVNLAVWNHNQNYKFLFSYSAPVEQLLNSGLASSLQGYSGTVLTETPSDERVWKISVDVGSTAENPGTLVDYGYYTEITSIVKKEDDAGHEYFETQTRIDRKGFAYHTGYIPMVLFASTKYNRPNSTKTFMYQTFGSEKAGDSDSNWYLRDPSTVASLNVASVHDKANINYIGETQQAGKIIRFYQDGYNTDGLDTACYCNEVWLKDAILSEILNAFIVNEKLPANNVGEAMVRQRIMGVIDEAISNGTILVNKVLTTSQMEYIDRTSGVEGAYESVLNNGYWLSITLRGRNSDKSTAYTADYVFIYAKGDAIRKVEGSNILL